MSDEKSFYKKHMELPEEVTRTVTFRTVKTIVLWIALFLGVCLILDKGLGVL